MTMVLRLAALPSARRMRVVESDQPLTIRSVERQRVVEAMRLLRRRGHTHHHEPHPMPAIRVHDEHLAVEVKKGVKSRVTGVRHLR